MPSSPDRPEQNCTSALSAHISISFLKNAHTTSLPDYHPTCSYLPVMYFFFQKNNMSYFDVDDSSSQTSYCLKTYNLALIHTVKARSRSLSSHPYSVNPHLAANNKPYHGTIYSSNLTQKATATLVCKSRSIPNLSCPSHQHLPSHAHCA
jgi:hypothetical protein